MTTKYTTPLVIGGHRKSDCLSVSLFLVTVGYGIRRGIFAPNYRTPVVDIGHHKASPCLSLLLLSVLPWALLYRTKLHPGEINTYDHVSFYVMSHSQMLGKVESGGGPIFKVVLEC